MIRTGTLPRFPNSSSEATSTSAVINPTYNLWIKQDQLFVELDSFNPQRRDFSPSGRLYDISDCLEVSCDYLQYLQKIKTCVANLAVVAHLVTDDALILYILGGLGQEYDVVVVPTRAKLVSLSNVHGLLLSPKYLLDEMTRILVSYATFLVLRYIIRPLD
ncbi:hypothetical protein R3W88_016445 [Solanum pinnatisectum]|uniref:Uncharacterized protein n=1 Tax=Solanum pinnatisectum TaxID=50273 RepID=A0AAV9L1L5_9SOLN|nr:hypothetical protein R3W88_016445 [Solanum pinnatisectum]